MTDSPPLKEKINSRRPKQYSVFSQQELPAFKLILTPGSVIASFLLLGIIFIPIGLTSLVASEKVVEVCIAMILIVFLQTTPIIRLDLYKTLKLTRLAIRN